MSAPTLQRWLVESVVIVVAYCVTAYAVAYSQSGLGGANLLWLPAGIALTAVLFRGAAALPAILLAGLVFNFYSLFAEAASSLQASAATLITAIGMTLEAWVAAWTLRRWIPLLQITTVPQAGLFILCTALGCMIAASIGTAGLLSQNRIGLDGISLSWLTWWVGDLSGMLVVTPLALVARQWKLGRREWSLLSLPIIGLGCSFTLVTAFIVKHLDNDARVIQFHSSGIAMGQALQRSLDLSRRDLMAANNLFYNIDISRQEFHHFANSVLAQNRLIRSLVWAPRVGGEQRARFEAEARRSGWSDYRILDRQPEGKPAPAAESTEYLPLLMAEPEHSHPGVQGLNLLSDPVRREAINLARATGEPRASRLVEMLRGGQAVVVYWPVYRNEYLNANSNHDNDNLRGFVSMALEIGKLAEETLRPFEHRGAETWLLDMTEPSHPEVLYHHIDGQPQPAEQTTPDIKQLRQGLFQETHHSFAGREWILVSRPRELHIGFKPNSQFIGVLVGGLGFTFMLAIYMIGRQRSEYALLARDERLMSQNAVLTQLARFGLSPEQDVDNHLRELIATSAGTLRVERVSLWMLEEEGKYLRCKMMFSHDSGTFSSGLELEAASAPSYFATLNEGRGFAANDAQHDPRTREFADSYLRPHGITSIMDVPVRIGGIPAGVVCHEHVGPQRTWAADEQNFAASIGDLASLVIESDRRHQAERALQDSYQALERKVGERTEQLRTANERLRQLDQLKSMFIASMSHELRTPLNSIIGFTGVVLQGISGEINDKQRDHLNRVYGSARHLLALITDVIDISKIEAGYADVYAETFSLNQMIDEAIASIQPQRLEKGLDMSTHLPETVSVHTDRKRLLQCLLNLLSNAVKYSEQGSIDIRLHTLADRIVIEVEDSGIGIRPEALARLFQPFERIDTHLRIKTPGTGLGLYLTRKIMNDLLQGGVEAVSTVGKGSVFRLWIPYALPTAG